MAKYVITYYGFPNFAAPQDGAAHMEKWRAWMGGLGAALVNPGSPMRPGKTLSATGVSDTSRADVLTGFSVLEADSLEAALAMAKGCPHLNHGTVDVAEAMDMGVG